MTGSSSATVETLTAEVRVLMVGSRQVTLSVFNQLDHVTDRLITPFGRVAPKEAAGDYVHVVGRHAKTGALVRSSLPVRSIAAWVVRYSKADSFDSKAAGAVHRAEKGGEQADAEQRQAEVLLGECGHDDSDYHYSEESAACHDNRERKFEQGAVDQDAAAAAADSELGRLSALADAADKRKRAATARAEAAGARTKAAALKDHAAELRMSAALLRTEAETHVQQAETWRNWEEEETARVHDAAAGWCALPLIVLAGLR